MIKLNLTIIAFLHTVLLLAQHDIQVVLSTNSQTTTCLEPGTYMTTGHQSNQLVEMEQLDPGQDGDLVVDLTNYDGTSDFIICLKADNTRKYCWKLTPTGAYVEEMGMMIAGTDITFTIGDEFRVVRCQDKILYYYNNRLVHATLLPDDTDILFGLVETMMATAIDLHIQFIPM